MSGGRYISFLIVHEEGGKTVSFRLHRNLLRLIIGFAAIILLILIAGAIFYGHLVKEAVKVGQLREENKALLQQNAEVFRLKEEIERREKE